MYIMKVCVCIQLCVFKWLYVCIINILTLSISRNRAFLMNIQNLDAVS